MNAPKKLEELSGQRGVRGLLGVLVDAARRKKDRLPHLLFHGGPGLGKTTFALSLSQELGVSLMHSTCVGMDSEALSRLLMQCKVRGILFLDEIHRLGVRQQEMLYTVMDFGWIQMPLERTVLKLSPRPLTLVGATTRLKLVAAPLRSRFGHVVYFSRYTDEELYAMLVHEQGQAGQHRLTSGGNSLLAAIANGVPRTLMKYYRFIQTFAYARHGSEDDRLLSQEDVIEALALMGVNEQGLGPQHREYLAVLLEADGGPLGVGVISDMMQESEEEIEDIVEPLLIQRGLITRGRGGRTLTEAGRECAG